MITVCTFAGRDPPKYWLNKLNQQLTAKKRKQKNERYTRKEIILTKKKRKEKQKTE